MPPKAKLLDIRYSTASVRTAHHVIERGAGRVRLGQVDGGGKPPLLHHLERQPGLDGTAGPRVWPK